MKQVVTKIFLVVACLFFCSVVHASSTKVYVIHSYLPGLWVYQGNRGVAEGFKKNNIETNLKYHIYDYLAFKTKSPQEKQNEVELIKKEIAGFKPDLIFIFDDEAADALVQSLNGLNIPMVITGINKEEKEISWIDEISPQKRNYTVIFERYPFEPSLKLLKRLNKQVTAINILTSKNETSSIVTKQISDRFEKYNNVCEGIRLDKVYMSDSWKEWQKIILENNRPNQSFWMLVPWNVNDEQGREVDLRLIGKYFREKSKVPAIGIVNINSQLGFLASFSVSAEDLGVQAADIGTKILRQNIRPNQISFQTINTIRFVINKKRAEELHYKIPTDLLEFAEVEKKIPMQFMR